MNRARKDRAATRMGNAHQLLHHPGGRRDLDAGDRTVDGLGQSIVDLLRLVRFGDRARMYLLGESVEALAPPPRVPHMLRHRVDPAGHSSFLLFRVWMIAGALTAS